MDEEWEKHVSKFVRVIRLGQGVMVKPVRDAPLANTGVVVTSALRHKSHVRNRQ